MGGDVETRSKRRRCSRQHGRSGVAYVASRPLPKRRPVALEPKEEALCAKGPPKQRRARRRPSPAESGVARCHREDGPKRRRVRTVPLLCGRQVLFATLREGPQVCVLVLNTTLIQSALQRKIVEVWSSALDVSCSQVLCGLYSKAERSNGQTNA